MMDLDRNVAFWAVSSVSFCRPKSTPTPSASFSVNGMPVEAVDYERLKQVDLICHHSLVATWEVKGHVMQPQML